MRLLPAVAVAGAALGLASCGFMGEPLPPLANIPARVADLSAVQRGAALIVQFTAPQLTTEGMAVKSDLKFDLRAGPGSAPWDENVWAAQAKAAAPTPEDGHVQYVFPAAEWAGKEVVVAVRVTGGNRKSAGWSTFLTLPVVPAPQRPRDVRADSVPGGVRLTWQAGGASFRVYRRSGEEPFTAVANPDRSDWTDTTVESGKPYSYLVQSIVKIGTREAESEASAEVTVTPADLFPPTVPAGLRVVTSPVSIELAWEPNAEADLAGYRVYRAVGNAELEKIGEVSGGPTYSDRSVEAGKVYRYAVSAFDKAGNESRPSPAVEAALP